MAPKKLENATLEDLEQIFKEHGRKPQIAHGLAVAARSVHFWKRMESDSRSEFHERKLKFLLSLLGEYDKSTLAEKIYAEVVRQLLEADSSFGLSGEQLQQFQQLVDFFGRHPPIEGIQGKVKEFLVRRATELTCSDGMVIPRLWESAARALLRYQLFDALEALVQQKVYHTIPALFEVVVEQAGKENALFIVWFGWRREENVARAFRLVGSDTRPLRLLLDLSQAHIDKYGGPYKLPGDDKERRRSVAY